MTRSIGATPIAILVGCALIAVAVYLGLRARPVAAIPAGVAGNPGATMTGAPSAAPAGAPGSPPPVSTLQTELLAKMSGAAPSGATDVKHDLLAGLDGQRPMLVEKCWKPLTAGVVDPKPANYELDSTIDETGHEVARGLSGKEGSSTALTQCLNAHSPMLVIPSRGVSTRVRVRFTLP